MIYCSPRLFCDPSQLPTLPLGVGRQGFCCFCLKERVFPSTEMYHHRNCYLHRQLSIHPHRFLWFTLHTLSVKLLKHPAPKQSQCVGLVSMLIQPSLSLLPASIPPVHLPAPEKVSSFYAMPVNQKNGLASSISLF